MRILCAPDSFKETLTARAVADAMAAGALRVDPSIQCDICPVADGGEGTMDVLLDAIGGTQHRATVTGPLGEPVNARFGVSNDGDTGVVELAQASGIALVPSHQRDPTRTTTFGTGELIGKAVSLGCKTVIVCVGGSATVDGATGIAQALGAKFFDRQGTLIERQMCGGLLSQIARFEPPPHFPHWPTLRVACDVTNPLCGPNGAAAVYGPQKGASPDQVRELNEGLAHLAGIVGGNPNTPGAGAAGGAGFGLAAMCGGRLERGIDLVLESVRFLERCAGADLVLTGEGRLDTQSLHGKACMGVARIAAEFGVPTVAIVGSTSPGAQDCVDPARGGLLQRFVSLAERFGTDRALRQPAELIARVTAELIAQLQTN